jgi:hypothetical protein
MKMTSTSTLIIVSLLAISELANARLFEGYNPNSDDKGRECSTKKDVGKKCMIDSHCCSGECAGFIFLDRTCKSAHGRYPRAIPVTKSFLQAEGASRHTVL